MTTAETAQDRVPLGALGPWARWTGLSVLRHGLLFVAGIVLYGVVYATVSGDLPILGDLVLVLMLATIYVGLPSAVVLALVGACRGALAPWALRTAAAVLLLVALAPVAAAFWTMEPAVPLALAAGQLAYALLILPVRKR
ncbi:hypothetical protein H9Y04_39490 [Streptomyces sp. TRM66268-LWL]|uniref:Integral membrane protein n=1 Tax=Streptomyces polyasparticus TaxID=2767826 RepID=A0ABR7ST05_9ACTN|nr:hypothetical protein [Streptomyces polyasparticus]MBC9718627.1 hypothetical protein [Streptomyces polyasparticus]